MEQALVFPGSHPVLIRLVNKVPTLHDDRPSSSRTYRITQKKPKNLRDCQQTSLKIIGLSSPMFSKQMPQVCLSLANADYIRLFTCTNSSLKKGPLSSKRLKKEGGKVKLRTSKPSWFRTADRHSIHTVQNQSNLRLES